MSIEQPKPKLKDIADAIGVSIATASRALRNDPRVSEETRYRIAQEARRIDYQLSNRTYDTSVDRNRGNKRQAPCERQLKRLYVLMLQPAPRAFYSEALVELLDQSRKLEIELEMVECTADDIAGNLSKAEAAGWDAVLVITLANLSEKQCQAVFSCRIPVVFFNRHIEGLTSAVTLDDYAAGVRAARYLVSLGHKRIAHLPGSQHSTAVRERTIGFRTGLELLGCYNPELFVQPLNTNDALQWTHASVNYLLELDEPPTAIWAFCDTIASATLVTLRAADLEVPRDISVMGFDNRPELLNSVLTTFDPRFSDMVSEALALLDNLVTGKVTDPIRICVVPKMIVRSSTGPVPRA